ncbi:MAG TPA: hypothetical protein G4O05_02895 [Caldilineae bacterium]|nr:hypothetical protein [Caldilineae bacterium]
MCGGTHHIAGALIGAAINGSRHTNHGHSHGSGHDHGQTPVQSQPSITQEIKLMYARGEIDSAAYHRLLEMARRGELSWDDLRELSARGDVATEQTVPADSPAERDQDIVRSLNKLYAHHASLEQSRTETEEILAKLEADAERLRKQAETARKKAEAVAERDEESARAYLAVRQDALARVAALEARIVALRQDLARLADLETELAAKEAELKALESQSKLAALEASIREDLIIG